MSNSDEKLCRYTDAYHSGIYTKDEAVGAMIEILASSPDFIGLWSGMPDWAQSAVWIFLKSCDETVVLYNVSTGSNEAISPRLIELKSWLAREKGYK
ncbi:hypothetical protein FNU76_01665 [Chitinimonas arctica]|uniref:Uncharacterized protein n=1 Tax=Chitinimonas arctica TaxID=2594795 RepID=A0A516SAJ3_9NEIS|nr:hypothetical protein [Chitinimonas arctica]QDQ25167.1 hypothetical protein FNU76_01665 [Chitinimonas arctica]